MSDEKYYISDCEEVFCDGPYLTREDAIADGRAEYEGRTFWVGKRGRSAAEVVAAQTDLADYVVDHLETRIYDRMGNDDAAISISNESLAAMNKLIVDFLAKNNAIDHRLFEIVEVEEIPALESEAE